MSITDELRRWARTWRNVYISEDDGTITYSTNASGVHLGNGSTMEELILAMADRIDKQTERESEAAWQRGYKRGEDDAEFEQLDEMRKEVQADWAPLPTDVDGLPIRIGDRVRIGYTEFEVIGFGNVTCDDETYGVFMQHESGEYEWFNARFLHHASDSWEHIIKDAVKLGYADYPTTSYEAELVERCKRLAGE